jgi:hypothetical protein
MSDLSKSLKLNRYIQKIDSIEEFMQEGRGPESGLKPADFNKEEFWAGIEVELEHTDDRKIASKIVWDHMAEFPKGGYYPALKVMETFLKSIDNWPQEERLKMIAGLGKVVEQYVLSAKGDKKREESDKESDTSTESTS